MPSPSFRIVCEGPTDASVIRATLAGWFEDKRIQAIRIPEPGSVAANPGNLGGWGNAIAFIASDQFEDALAYADFLVVHIDADKCEYFGVSAHHDGKRIDDREIALLVAAKLRLHIGDAWSRIGENVIFAIAVDSIECWLLAHYADKTRPVPSQTCFDKLRAFVATAKPERITRLTKDKTLYDVLAKPLSKRKDLEKARQYNQSLSLFLDGIARATNPPTHELL